MGNLILYYKSQKQKMSTVTFTYTSTSTGKETVLKSIYKEKQEEQPVLKLKTKPPKRKVVWREDTIDNEHMNKRRSNICCIFHPNRDSREKGLFSESPETCSSDS